MINYEHGHTHETKLFMLKNLVSACKSTMVGSVSRTHNIRILNSCLMHHHASPAPDIMIWDGIVITLTHPLSIAMHTDELELYF